MDFRRQRCIPTLLLLAFLCPPGHLRAQAPAAEVRAVWLTTLSGLDWPKTKVLTPSDTLRQQHELIRILDSLQAARFNTVFFQTRVRATVAYPSAIEPWDECFTGTALRSPYYDPLAFAVAECHKRGIELHAWIVAFPNISFAQAKALGSSALHKRHPEMVLKTNKSYMTNPGVPAAAEYLNSICREIVENYDVDGIHLDYMRYPEREIKYNDSKTFQTYRSGGESLQSWREDNITSCLRLISHTTRSLKPWVKLSCSVIGKRADLPRYSAGGWSASGRVAQDVRRWVDEGLVDIIVPMLYFDGNDFYPFLQDWLEITEGTGTQVVAGLATYRLGKRGWQLSTLRRQIEVSRQMGAAGQAFFRSAFVTGNVLGNYELLRDLIYDTAAAAPCALRNDTVRPQPPTGAAIVSLTSTPRLVWEPSATPGVTYNVYATFDYGDTSVTGGVLKASGLTETTFDTALPLLPNMLPYYKVTAVDRFGRESEPLIFNAPPTVRPLGFDPVRRQSDASDR